MVAQPQDRKPSVQEMLHNALQLQGANFAMKGQLDMMATKIVLCLKALKKVDTIGDDGYIHVSGSDEYLGARQAEDALNEVRGVLSMTRDQTAQARKGFEYDDPRIQAVINEAAQKLCDILLENGKS